MLAAQLHEDCALPFGFTLQPFGAHPHVPLHQAPQLRAPDIPRCTHCGAYLNCFNATDMIGFRCGVCRSYMEWNARQAKQYGEAKGRHRRVELMGQLYEAVCPDYDDDLVRQGAALQTWWPALVAITQMPARSAHVASVTCSMSHTL